jgi:hypothetical protein
LTQEQKNKPLLICKSNYIRNTLLYQEYFGWKQRNALKEKALLFVRPRERGKIQEALLLINSKARPLFGKSNTVSY